MPVEYHGEDYSLPYCWTAAATYLLCLICHRHKLRRRFSASDEWRAFLAHVRRGGYARDLRDPVIKRELKWYDAAAKRGGSQELRSLRPYLKTTADEWFSALSLDLAAMSWSTRRHRP